jgi:hypothetical protein
MPFLLSLKKEALSLVYLQALCQFSSYTTFKVLTGKGLDPI